MKEGAHTKCLTTEHLPEQLQGVYWSLCEAPVPLKRGQGVAEECLQDF